jgi:hypothetical protein
MGWIVVLGAGLLVGLVVARWWLLPLPIVAYFILDAASPVARDDDVTGFGRAVVFGGFLVALIIGTVGGKLIRRIGRPHDGRKHDEEIQN